LQWLDLQSGYWDISEQLAFITVLVVVFFGLVGIATTAQVYEVITTTISHATLVIFMQLNSSYPLYGTNIQNHIDMFCSLTVDTRRKEFG
jgi:hypothetical protein